MVRLKSLSVFFPCLNDAESIPFLLRRTYQVLPKITADFEVIIIDDGSTDNTKALLSKLRTTYENLRIIRNKKSSGYGGALISGFKNAKKQWIFYTDGDGQYDPGELTKMVSELDENTDVVNGYKISRGDNLLRKSLGSLYNQMLHIFYSIPIRDVDCDFRLIRRSKLAEIELKSKSGGICLELVMKLKNEGAKFAETPVHHYPRKHGGSAFFKISNITQTLFENIRLFRESLAADFWQPKRG